MPARSIHHAKTARTQRTEAGRQARPRSGREGRSVGRAPRQRAVRENALALLQADHDLVLDLFARVARIKSHGAQKANLVARICTELERHAQVEEEIVYPGVRAAIADDPLMDEAAVEHDIAKSLVKELRRMRVDGPQYDAKVTVLGEYVRHHVREEQNEMFPKVRKSDRDLVALGRAIKSRKRQLKVEARTQQLIALSAMPGLMLA